MTSNVFDRFLEPGRYDDRGYARPGDSDLAMSLAGVRVASVTPLEDGQTFIKFDLSHAAGWWRPRGEGKRIPFTGQFGTISGNFSSHLSHGTGYVTGTLWCLHTWMTTNLPLEMYAALGRLTILHCPLHERSQIVVFPPLAPPGADGKPADPGSPPGAASEPPPGDEVEGAYVTVITGDDGGTFYSRIWTIHRSRAEDLVGAMKTRFGEPVESVADARRVLELGAQSGAVVSGCQCDDGEDPSQDHSGTG